MRSVTAICSMLWLMLAGAEALAARIEIYDRANGERLPIHEHEGRSYIAGEPGHEYEIRVHSDESQRVLAVASVDGVNVITGQTAATSQSGYVLDAYGFVRIEGWRKSMSRTAAFYFTKLPDSYAARTGRPDNVGVIGVAVFRERRPCCAVEQHSMTREDAARGRESGDAAAAQSAPLERREDKRLGTGHGRSEYSAARYTEFTRASDVPDETLIIHYDSRRNLVTQGVIPTLSRRAGRIPQAFPAGFVPNP